MQCRLQRWVNHKPYCEKSMHCVCTSWWVYRNYQIIREFGTMKLMLMKTNVLMIDLAPLKLQIGQQEVVIPSCSLTNQAKYLEWVFLTRKYKYEPRMHANSVLRAITQLITTLKVTYVCRNNDVKILHILYTYMLYTRLY